MLYGWVIKIPYLNYLIIQHSAKRFVPDRIWERENFKVIEDKGLYYPPYRKYIISNGKQTYAFYTTRKLKKGDPIGEVQIFRIDLNKNELHFVEVFPPKEKPKRTIPPEEKLKQKLTEIFKEMNTIDLLSANVDVLREKGYYPSKTFFELEKLQEKWEETTRPEAWAGLREVVFYCMHGNTDRKLGQIIEQAKPEKYQDLDKKIEELPSLLEGREKVSIALREGKHVITDDGRKIKTNWPYTPRREYCLKIEEKGGKLIDATEPPENEELLKELWEAFTKSMNRFEHLYRDLKKYLGKYSSCKIAKKKL